jgi:V-type H+-transporting ATPase subunit a
MFGDILHGGLLLIFGLYLIFFNETISNTKLKLNKFRRGNNHVLKDLSPIRYLFALMGFFAFYCGFIYNDFAALRLNLFGSCYAEDKK